MNKQVKKRYAVLSLKEQPYIYTKRDVIYLGSKPLKVQEQVINALNDKNALNNVTSQYIYTISEDHYMLEDIARYKVKYKSNGSTSLALIF